ncbi:MAG: branched-chain amino acid ABC transporter permease [Deltaproteobacteria bacterium]|nr:branched-chain amino acid ABC transporter permease [Deltaproteobacteria bacterium]
MDKRKLIHLIVLTALLVFPALTQDPYLLNLLITTGIWTTSVWGVRLIMTTGQLTLGHAAYMAVGAYASTLLVMKAGLSFWLALPLSGLISAFVALLIGFPTLRIKGVYFAIITFAFAEIIRLIIVHWPSLLGGFGGIPNIPRPEPIFSIHFTSRVSYYYLILVISLITYLIMGRMERSRIGKIFSSIHESDTLAESIGINLMKYKIIAFCIGCFFAGLSGSFYAHYFSFTSPEFFTIWPSIYCLIFVLVGGAGSVLGPPLGSFFLTLVPELLRVAREFEPVVYAGILFLIMFLLPGGLITLPSRLLGQKKTH